jgi:hypothetical protein
MASSNSLEWLKWLFLIIVAIASAVVAFYFLPGN